MMDMRLDGWGLSRVCGRESRGAGGGPDAGHLPAGRDLEPCPSHLPPYGLSFGSEPLGINAT